MFTMMNLERIVVGIQGLGISEIAYQNSLKLTLKRENKEKQIIQNQLMVQILLLNMLILRKSLLNMKSIIEGEKELYVFGFLNKQKLVFIILMIKLNRRLLIMFRL